jgi:polyvinyl alcohol dehydrogenase (cytochrome)
MVKEVCRFVARVCALSVVLIGVGIADAAAQSPSGEAVYKTHCAACHDQVSARVPHRDALRRMPAARILRALDSGTMMGVAFTINRPDRLAVASYLGTTDAIAGPPAAAFCRDRSVKLAAQPSIAWNGWSPDTANTRFQPRAAAGLSADQVPKLRLRWAFGFDGDVSAFSQPTVIDGHIFVGSAAGVVHAMQADSGCLKWTFQANGPVRAAIVSASMNGRPVLLFGDMTGWFYALRAETGELAWKAHIDTHDSTRLTAAATAHDGVVYVPVSSWEESRASDTAYPCCTFRGSVVALRIADGTQLWRTYLVPPSKELGRTASGVPAFGPSGVGVWATPTLDAKRGRLYVATAGNYSIPATELSDAVIALELKSGRITWSKQFTKGDVFSGACPPKAPSCPDGPGPDFDFGSPVILTTQNGRDLLLAGQKSGVVHALDPDKEGAVIWQTRVGKGGTSGGVQWGMSTDGDSVYAAVSDMDRTLENRPPEPRRFIVNRTVGGGLSALRIADGSTRWTVPPVPCADDAPAGCNPAQSAAVTGIPGVVFSPSNDGHVRAYDAATGKVLWEFNTIRDFDTVNRVQARGGSIDGPGVVVVGGTVFVTSGYSRNGGIPGNVLLAFTP